MFDFLTDFSFFSGDLGQILLLGFAVLCVLPIIAVVVAGYLLIRRIQTFTETDYNKIEQEFQKLQARDPNSSREKIIRKVIGRQAFKSGVVGAVTGLGGFYTLPVMLPADILISTRIQAEMVRFIATAYGHNQTSDIEARVQTYLVTTGSIRLTESLVARGTRFAVRLMGKSFSKLIPFVGAFISFGVNYFIAQAMGNVAMQYYANRDQVINRMVQPPPPTGRLPGGET